MAKDLKHTVGDKQRLLLFVLVFALIGGYVLIRSLAAPNPNLPGDLNADNSVNVTDLSILLSNYGTTNTNADINNDGSVNVLDLSILLSHYGSSYVPPPASSRWFADNSYINTKVPAAPAIDPNNTQYQQAIRTTTYIWANGTSSMGGQWSATVYHSDSSTPKRTISLVVPYMGSSSVTFPYAAGWLPTPDTDGHMVVIEPGGTAWEFQGLDQAVTNAHSVAQHNITGDAVNTSQDAVSPMPTFAGMIRPEDFASGVINHGIRTVVPFASNQVRWPAIWSDGNTAGGPPSGAHLWLPRNADLSSLTDQYQRMVATAMQEYGMWIGDSGGNSIAIQVQSTWNNNASYPFTSLSLPQQIVNQLVVLTQ